jgi:NAD-dependent SIR2 family protein deacetylase
LKLPNWKIITVPAQIKIQRNGKESLFDREWNLFFSNPLSFWKNYKDNLPSDNERYYPNIGTYTNAQLHDADDLVVHSGILTQLSGKKFPRVTAKLI